MKKISLIFLMIVCSACATVKTVDPQRNRITVEYRGAKTYCETIPRIYSGVTYNLCMFYGEPNRQVTPAMSAILIPYRITDTVLSAVADTIVLPYTLFLQHEKGAMLVN